MTFDSFFFCADLSARSRRDFDPSNMRVNTGTKNLKLFWPPVPEPARIPLQDVNYNREWRRYHSATLKVHIFQGQPRPGSLTPSDLSDDNEEVLPEVGLGEPFLSLLFDAEL